MPNRAGCLPAGVKLALSCTIRSFEYMRTYTYMHVAYYICKYIQVRIHTYVQTYTLTNMYKRTQAHTRATHMQIHTMHIYVHTQTCIYVWMYCTALQKNLIFSFFAHTYVLIKF